MSLLKKILRFLLTSRCSVRLRMVQQAKYHKRRKIGCKKRRRKYLKCLGGGLNWQKPLNSTGLCLMVGFIFGIIFSMFSEIQSMMLVFILSCASCWKSFSKVWRTPLKKSRQKILFIMILIPRSKLLLTLGWWMLAWWKITSKLMKW